jgi:hypothetical protein
MFKISSLLLMLFLPFHFIVKTDLTPPLSISDSKFEMSHSEHSHNLKSFSKKGKIQVALLLDTSNSMDGLIDQAKSQLWKMVNKLASAKKEGEYTDIEIALFEYGNDNLAMGEGYIRMISSLSHDVDGLSEQLFKLKTQGGSEYCGWVIGDAVSNLKWSDDDKDLKLLIIAGNEPFDQGPKDFRETCKQAEKKGIIINTVHCGDWKTGVETHWKDGADIGKGKYLNIETDRKIIHIRTPYDDIMIQLNLRLNKTYLGYGSTGAKMMERQQAQDSNAASYGVANAASRTAYKAKAQYKNTEWDIVDAEEAKQISVEKMKKEELPEEMKKMSIEKRKAYIEKLSKEREAVKKEIQETEKKIQDFTAKEMKKEGETLTLDKVMEEAVVAQALAQGFKFE